MIMTFAEFKTAASDYFTPAEFIELIDIPTHTLIALLQDEGYLDEDVLTDIEEIMGVSDDE